MTRRILPAFVLLILVISFVPVLFRSRVEPGANAVANPAAVVASRPASFDSASIPEEVRQLLQSGQNWRAARVMRAFLEREPNASPATILVAARAEAGWGGWDRVHALLADREWLSAEAGGEGWFWFARALEEERDTTRAIGAYGRYLAASDASAAPDRRAVAGLRRGLLLLASGDVAAGVESLRELRAGSPDAARWADLLSAEALASRGDTARVRELVANLRSDSGFGTRADQALLLAVLEAGDDRGAFELARSLGAAAEGEGTRAGYAFDAARAALALGDTAAARSELNRALTAAPGSSAALRAGVLLSELGGLSAAERLAVARVFDRHGRNEQAAREYRRWLATGAGSAEERREVRWSRGRALFDAGEYAEAEATLDELSDAPPEFAARAMHLKGRAQYRRGARQQALNTFTRTADRFPGTEPGAEALFLVADLSHDAGDLGRARQGYRRIASEFPGKDRAGLSLMRLGGMAYLERDYPAAVAAWEEYRTSYPRGERWLEATYWAARAHEAAGDTAAAADLYRAIPAREPLSYYSLRAAQRTGKSFWPVPFSASPPEDASARARVERGLHAADLLRDAGLFDEAEAEADRQIRAAGEDERLLYPLAEALIERGYTVRGIRLGLRLRDRAGQPSERLLRILYPFPYRSVIQAEARERELDPFLVAALVRQESMFKARIASHVGARGLMQIMPETGRPLARAAGIQRWDPELLYQPEINVHLGTRYLAEQMRSYNGSLPSVFSAYNAGPHRIERWKEFPEYGDEELFTERIPYRETRDYVKILTRNRAIYQGLYGAGATE